MYPPQKPCPCGSKQPFIQCCAPHLAGAPAPTPEALMRSRYTAFTLQDRDYLLRTWHPATRPAKLHLGGVQWLGLVVRRAQGDTVSFSARYQEGKRKGEMHEKSRFVQERGQWFYLDGVEAS